MEGLPLLRPQTVAVRGNAGLAGIRRTIYNRTVARPESRTREDRPA
jgi:hypothetical protein